MDTITKADLKMFTLELRGTEHNGYRTYGFIAYNNDGHSMPKGYMTSYCATQYDSNGDTDIEFSIQSPTGDSSDHHHYSFPCRSWEQAKIMVSQQYRAYSNMLAEYEEALV